MLTPFYQNTVSRHTVFYQKKRGLGQRIFSRVFANTGKDLPPHIHGNFTIAGNALLYYNKEKTSGGPEEQG
jgi:hypothetical protein